MEPNSSVYNGNALDLQTARAKLEDYYLECSERLVRYFAKNTRNHYLPNRELMESSKDLASETYRKALEKIHQLRGEEVGPWFWKIAKNLLLQYRRRNVNETLSFFHNTRMRIAFGAYSVEDLDEVLESHGQDSEMVDGGLEERINTKRTVALVSDGIRALPVLYRNPIDLFYRDELSCKEIANLLGIAENTVKTRLRRGRGMLKNWLVAYLPPQAQLDDRD